WQAGTTSSRTRASAPLASVLDDRRILAALTRDIGIVGELFLTPQLETAIQILDQVGPGRGEVVLFRRIVHLIPQVISPVPFREEQLEPRADNRGLECRRRLDNRVKAAIQVRLRLEEADPLETRVGGK